MRKNLTVFILFFSLCLLLGHTLFPHNHQGEDYKICKISSREDLSISQILANTLSRDLGVNHLTDYAKSKMLNMQIHEQIPTGSAGFLVWESNENTFQITSELFFSDPIRLDSQHFFHGTGLRAPPVWS